MPKISQTLMGLTGLFMALALTSCDASLDSNLTDGAQESIIQDRYDLNKGEFERLGLFGVYTASLVSNERDVVLDVRLDIFPMGEPVRIGGKSSYIDVPKAMLIVLDVRKKDEDPTGRLEPNYTATRILDLDFFSETKQISFRGSNMGSPGSTVRNFGFFNMSGKIVKDGLLIKLIYDHISSYKPTQFKKIGEIDY